jgi:co-chaperonin GroES (HSP10)
MNFKPLNDLILVLPDPLQTQSNGVVLPQGVLQPGDKAGDSSDCFMGTVVAVGLGDRHAPFESLKCRVCHKKRCFSVAMDSYVCECGPFAAVPYEQAREWNAGRHPMLTKVGDRVVSPRRPSSPGGEFSVTLNGVLYVMFNEEQSAFAVIEE